MQKFKVKFKNVPRDAPQVPCSTSLSLNRDQSLSETSKVRTLNNLDVDLHQRKGGQKVSVVTYVLNINEKPLMSCSCRKARILLKKGEAKVLKTNPFFVIQLTKETSNHIQECSLGIDSGYKHVGFSVFLKRNKQYKDSTFMNIVRWRFREALPDCKLTYGNETFVKRNELRLEKSHYNDAFVIANGNKQDKVSPIFLKQKHKNNRKLQINRKGFKPSIRRQRYSIQPYDIVTINNKKYIVKGCHCYGRSVGFTDGINNLDCSVKKVEKVFHICSIFQNKD
jgi:RRXRR protein